MLRFEPEELARLDTLAREAGTPGLPPAHPRHHARGRGRPSPRGSAFWPRRTSSVRPARQGYPAGSGHPPCRSPDPGRAGSAADTCGDRKGDKALVTAPCSFRPAQDGVKLDPAHAPEQQRAAWRTALSLVRPPQQFVPRQPRLWRNAGQRGQAPEGPGDNVRGAPGPGKRGQGHTFRPRTSAISAREPCGVSPLSRGQPDRGHLIGYLRDRSPSPGLHCSRISRPRCRAQTTLPRSCGPATITRSSTGSTRWPDLTGACLPLRPRTLPAGRRGAPFPGSGRN